MVPSCRCTVTKEKETALSVLAKSDKGNGNDAVLEGGWGEQ